MDMLHDFLMFIGGTVLGGLILGAFTYLMFESIKANAYTKGYMDGWKDATDKANTGVKEAQKYQ